MYPRIPSILAKLSFVLLVLTVGSSHSFGADSKYSLGPDSQRQPGVPAGKVEKHVFSNSHIFPGTTRNYWIYVPAQYDPSHPACTMIFQDGGGAVSTNGDWRVPIVFDNLIARGEMPVTIGIFIDPGVVPASNTNALPRFNRSLEYDGLGDHYARFLLEEMLPEVSKSYNLAADGNSRAIAGLSSGAICAFNAAWERPEAFSRVMSAIGTFVGLRGGNEFPTLIRKTEPKPIRVFLQDGTNDLNIYGGNWWLANQEMFSALQFAGYEVNHTWGEEGHSGRQLGSIMPDALRWLWKDYPTPVKAGAESHQPLMDIVSRSSGWHQVADGYQSAGGAIADDQGNLFFSDASAGRIYKVDATGQASEFVSNCSGAAGECFGSDGSLYVCQAGNHRIMKYFPGGHKSAVASGVNAHDLCVSHNGRIYATDPQDHQIWLIQPDGKKQVVGVNLVTPTGIRFTPDQTFLIVNDASQRMVDSYQIQSDGTLANKQSYYHLHVTDDDHGSLANGMTLDTEGRLYVATEMGVQICDQAGRVIGIIPRPEAAPVTSVTFGGVNHDELFVTCGNKVFARETKTHGVYSWQPPVKPAPPRL